MFFAIDVIEKVDGVFDNAVADVAEVTAALAIAERDEKEDLLDFITKTLNRLQNLLGRCFVQHHRFAKFTLKIDFVFTCFQQLSRRLLYLSASLLDLLYPVECFALQSWKN